MTIIYVNPDNYCQFVVAVTHTDDDSLLLCNAVEPAFDGKHFIIPEGFYCDAIYFAKYENYAVNTSLWKDLLTEVDAYERHMESMADSYFDSLSGE